MDMQQKTVQYFLNLLVCWVLDEKDYWSVTGFFDGTSGNKVIVFDLIDYSFSAVVPSEIDDNKHFVVGVQELDLAYLHDVAHSYALESSETDQVSPDLEKEQFEYIYSKDVIAYWFHDSKVDVLFKDKLATMSVFSQHFIYETLREMWVVVSQKSPDSFAEFQNMKEIIDKDKLSSLGVEFLN